MFIKMKLIAAVSENWGIGKDNKLLFHIPKDMQFFRKKTMGKTVILGRKNLESFPGGKPLKNRINVVLTHNKNFQKDGIITENSLSIFSLFSAFIYLHSLPQFLIKEKRSRSSPPFL